MKELGSEFWDMPHGRTASEPGDHQTQFVLSGRTALELVARDLKTERGSRSVCLPAFCCDSMIVPFRRAGLEVRFYDVLPSADGIERALPVNHSCDAVLLLDYFGFAQQETAWLAERESKRGTAVILDRVQALYSETDAQQHADYTVTSWRKWFFSCAAAATKRCGAWIEKASKPAMEEYVSLRREAARQKAAYLERGLGDKQRFLDRFSRAEELLDFDFSDYAADPESVEELSFLDVSFLKRRRRENADSIYTALWNLGDHRVRPLFPMQNAEDTPLFVPVLVDPLIRADLRRFLIHNQVFCPIHWPDPHTGGGEILYAQELSLLCDQRYTKADMERETNLIKEFLDQDV